MSDTVRWLAGVRCAVMMPPSQPAQAAMKQKSVGRKRARAQGSSTDFSAMPRRVIDYPDGDVTVIGSVSSGAEIVAGGSIHVYGTLRGRALAGTAGDPSARIFCRRFQPELVAINGSYRLADNFAAELADLRDRPVQARLEGTKMSITPLD